MNTIMILLLVFGIINILAPFFMTAKGFISVIIFKILPFVSGLLMVIISVQYFGWIVIK